MSDHVPTLLELVVTLYGEFDLGTSPLIVADWHEEEGNLAAARLLRLYGELPEWREVRVRWEGINGLEGDREAAVQEKT